MSGPLLIGLPGTELDETSRAQLNHPAVGGVVLFTRNYASADQFDLLIQSIREIRSPRLLICIDQEGGRVQRLREGYTSLPPLAAIGERFDSDPDKAVDLAYRHGRVMATEMLAAGIDLSFAPVLDLNRGSCVIGDRSFSAYPETVTGLGRAYLAGMHDSGMKTTGKHFPGHGSIEADSHVDDVTDERAYPEIQESDMQPFQALTDDLDALMIAHVVYPAVDTLPAGYSKRWLQDILRSDLGYRGVVFSDDLGMHAARAVGDLKQRTALCLEAGCDLVLVCQPEDVRELLPGFEQSDDDATSLIERLYGKPTVSRAELLSLKPEGIREFAHWQKTLEAMIS